jgi:transcriptional regulator with XRE-family HTH domain
MDSINERFREVRKLLGKSQDAFAAEANRTRSEISNIEYGKNAPKPEVISAVCSAHGIDRVWLETGVGEPFRPRSREDEIAAALAQAMNCNESAKNRIIRAMAQLPDELFPYVERILDELAANIQQDK